MSFLDGYKTYIVIVLQAIYDILSAAGIAVPDALSQPKALIMINGIMALLAIAFNYSGRKRIMRGK